MCINSVMHTCVYGITIPWVDVEKIMKTLNITHYDELTQLLYKYIPLSDIETWTDHNQNKYPLQGYIFTYYEGYEYGYNDENEVEHIFGINIDTGENYKDLVKNIINVPPIVTINYEKYCLPLLSKAGITPTEPSVHLYTERDT